MNKHVFGDFEPHTDGVNIIANRYEYAWGPPQGGGPGDHGPQILGKILLCTKINVQCFSLKKQWNAYIIE